jgi:hypothetical protein
VEEARLAYRVRSAEASDAKPLRDAIGSTLAHPDHQGRRESYSGAASRGDILVLERYDRPAHDWQIAGFVECHMRVDDNLSIRDVGTAGDEPQTAVIRYLLDQAFNSYKPDAAQVKIRRDATAWLDIFRTIPGFYLDGEEYRRPHYWTIWLWDRQHAADAQRPVRQPQPAARPAPTPPRPPTTNTQPPRPRAVDGLAPPRRRDPRPAGSPGPGRPAGPRPARPARRPGRPANPR